MGLNDTYTKDNRFKHKKGPLRLKPHPQRGKMRLWVDITHMHRTIGLNIKKDPHDLNHTSKGQNEIMGLNYTYTKDNRLKKEANTILNLNVKT